MLREVEYWRTTSPDLPCRQRVLLWAELPSRVLCPPCPSKNCNFSLQTALFEPLLETRAKTDPLLVIDHVSKCSPIHVDSSFGSGRQWHDLLEASSPQAQTTHKQKQSFPGNLPLLPCHCPICSFVKPLPRTLLLSPDNGDLNHALLLFSQ
jgi:hypothetical protein